MHANCALHYFKEGEGWGVEKGGKGGRYCGKQKGKRGRNRKGGIGRRRRQKENIAKFIDPLC